MSRGIRNNNPGNIKHSGAKWIGLTSHKVAGVWQPDPVFATFDKPVHGIRALAVILRNYERIHGINTVFGLTSRWAPKEDKNPTGAYAIFLAGKVGVAPRAKIVITSYPTILRLVEGIIKFENGKQPYPQELLIDAIKLAGIKVPENVG